VVRSRALRILALVGSVLRYAIAGVALVVFLATLVLWPRSYWKSETFALQGMRKTESRYTYATLRLNSSLGGFTAHLYANDARDPILVRFYRRAPIGPVVTHSSGTPVRAPVAVRLAGRAGWWRWGFGYAREQNLTPPLVFSHLLWVPHWFVLLISGSLSWVLVARLLRLRRKRLRARAGLCVECGYDLRASPQRCPECGKERAEFMQAEACTPRGAV
jgi:hypothetical protein